MTWILFAMAAAADFLQMTINAATGHPWMACLCCFRSCVFVAISIAEYVDHQYEEGE